jgi:hypothetical protein
MRWRNGFDRGLPLVLPLESTYQDLLEAAGPGRYRLELVGADRKAILGAPVGCTGDLGDDDDRDADDPQDGDATNDDGSRRSGQGLGQNELLSQLLQSNARMTASALHQVTAVLTGAAQLVTAAHGAGLTSRLAAPVAQPLPLPVPPSLDDAEDVDEEDDEDDELEADTDEGPDGPGAPPGSGLPELVQFFIKETIANLTPLIVDKLTATFATLPVGALTDWRKAAPAGVTAPSQDTTTTHNHTAPAATSTHAATAATWAPPDATSAPSGWDTRATPSPRWARQDVSVQSPDTHPPDTTARSVTTMHPRASTADTRHAQSAGTPIVGAAETVASAPPAVSAPATLPSGPLHPAATSQLAGGAVAGAASQRPLTREAVPAEAEGRQADDRSALVNERFTAVWNALGEQERMRAVKLIARLSPEVRAALVEELSSLPLDEAVARARTLIRGRAPTA